MAYIWVKFTQGKQAIYRTKRIICKKKYLELKKVLVKFGWRGCFFNINFDGGKTKNNKKLPN